MSTISGVSGSGNAWAALNAQRSQHQAKMFAKVDADGSGGVDQAELGTMLEDVSKKTGVSLGDSKELFSKMDSNGDGSLTSGELDAGMQSAMPPPPTTMDFAQSRGSDTASGGEGSPDDLFAKIDTNSDGSVSKDELKVLTDKIKSDTGQDVSQDFSKLDADGDGNLTKTEFAAGQPQPPQGAAGAQGKGGPSGPPPAGGSGGAHGAGGASSASSSSSTTYDRLDTNQDGTVSEMERLVGEIKDATAKLDSSNSKSGTAKDSNAKFDIAELAKQIYAQVAEGLASKSGSTLSATA